MNPIEQLREPRNPYDKDLIALREACFYLAEKIESLEKAVYPKSEAKETVIEPPTLHVKQPKVKKNG